MLGQPDAERATASAKVKSRRRSPFHYCGFSSSGRLCRSRCFGLAASTQLLLLRFSAPRCSTLSSKLMIGISTQGYRLRAKIMQRLNYGEGSKNQQ